MPTKSDPPRHIDIIVHFQAAVRTVRLYPTSSPLIATAVQSLLADIDGILEERDSFVLAESENSLIVDGKPLDRKSQARDQAAAMLQSFRSLGIKSLSFSRGVTQAELRQVIALLGEDPRELAGEALSRRLARMEMPHVEVNQKVFVAVDRDRRIMPSLQVRDEDIVRYLAGDETPTEEALQKMRSLAENPRWIAEVFATGLERIASRLGPAPNARLSSSMGRLLEAMDRLIGEGGLQEISEHLAARVSQLDVEAIVAVSLQHANTPLWAPFFGSLAKHLGDEKRRVLTERLEAIAAAGTPEDGAPSANPGVQSAVRLLKRMAEGRLSENKAPEASSPQAQAAHFPEGFKTFLSRIIAGDFSPLSDAQVRGELCRLVHVLQQKGKEAAAARIVEALLRGLDEAPEKIQPDVADGLHEISADGNGNHPLAAAAAKRLQEWLRRRENLSPAFERLCRRLSEDARARMAAGECSRALGPVSALASAANNPRAAPALRARARKALAQASDDEVVRRLLAEIGTHAGDGRDAATRILQHLGPDCVPAALDLLRDTQDAQVRLRILKLVSGIGAPAAPAVRRALQSEVPWYFVRNLVRLLGEIGNENDLDILSPLLDHAEFRVRWQVLNSIYQIGGNRRGELLLQRLDREEDRLKIHIVTMLGELRHREAVPALVRLLEKKTLVSSEEKVQLQKKACLALARIGSPLAIPILSEIARGGKLTRMRPYHSEVRKTARESLQRLQVSCHTPSSPVCKPPSQ